MLGLFMIFPVMSVYASNYDNSSPLLIGLAIGIYRLTQAFFGGAIGGLIYNIYDLNSVFLLSIFIGIIWWFLMITLPQKVETL